jgi:hypothetical protein
MAEEAEARRPGAGGGRSGTASRRPADEPSEPEVTAEEDEEHASGEDAKDAPAQDEEKGSGDGGKKRRRDESQITAPSLGPGTVIEREPVEVRLARHEQSEVDAIGEDKRRQVVGQSYGPSKARQILLYGIFLICVAALFIGGKFLVDSLDTPVGKHVPHTAPWAKQDAKQRPPKPLQ